MKNKREIIESKYPPVNNEDLWLKDSKLYHSTSRGWVPLSEEPSITETYEQGVSSISYSGKDGQEHQIELAENVAGDISEEINNEFVSNDNNNIVFTDSNENQHELLTASGLGKAQVIEITWLELKDLRDNSQLVAGSLYRITDYNCTTTQENTRSAGHQFDIVLLALSEDKLAEEGWAMMHIDNIYKVVFDDNEVVSCYVTPMANHSNRYYVVNVDTLLGTDITITSDRIDEDNKIITLIGGWTPDALADPYLPYNYFQNSNLSAWKVWYCLDNDADRFAWADDSVDEDVDSFITISNDPGIIYYYKSSVPGGKHLWESSGDAAVYTDSETPENRDTVYNYQKRTGYSAIGEVTSYTPAHEGTGLPNGRGVIYRLIDEWNNDVPYDFKNIQYVRKLTDGAYDAQGTDTWVYTFNGYYLATEEILDASIHTGELLYEDDTLKHAVYNNVISSFIPQQNYTSKYLLSNICVLDIIDKDSDKYLRISNSTIKDCYDITVEGFITDVTIMSSGNCCVELNEGNSTIIGVWTTRTYRPGIYIGTKKVVLENI